MVHVGQLRQHVNLVTSSSVPRLILDTMHNVYNLTIRGPNYAIHWYSSVKR